ncbi:glycosyltransferase family 39 protein [Streptomyces eurocidicus]|uniref:glycosyltransferase family 39 protein n=1 Tax=Streptomyces eurocidicus TaxID=66423 RepID=UPI0035DBB96F
MRPVAERGGRRAAVPGPPDPVRPSDSSDPSNPSNLSGPSAPPRSAGPPRRAAVLAVVTPVAVMLVLGLWGLDRGTMWRDESATFQIARRSLPEIWHALGTVDAVHGLYYLLMHAVLAVRDDEIALRLPSVAASAATVALVAALGCRLARPRVGLWAGLLYATTPFVSHYAQEARSYAMVAAGAALATWLLVRAVERGSPGRWAGYGAVVAGTALLHEFAILLAAAHAVTLLVSRVPWRTWRAWACAVAGCCLALLPLAVVSRAQSAQVSWIRTPGRREAEALLYAFAGPGEPVLTVTLVLAGVSLLAPSAGRAWRLLAPARPFPPYRRAARPRGGDGPPVPLARSARPPRTPAGPDPAPERPAPPARWSLGRVSGGGRAARFRAVFGHVGRVQHVGDVRHVRDVGPVRPGAPVSLNAVAWPLAVVPPVLLFGAAQYQPLFLDRYLLFCLAGVPLLAASGADRLVAAFRPPGTRAWRRAVAAAGALAVVAAFACQLPAQRRERLPVSRGDELAPVAALVGRLAGPGDAVLFLPLHERRVSLAYPRDFTGLRDLTLDRSPAASGTLFGEEVTTGALRDRLARLPPGSRVWVVQDTATVGTRWFRAQRAEYAKTTVLDRFCEEGSSVFVRGGAVTLRVRR